MRVGKSTLYRALDLEHETAALHWAGQTAGDGAAGVSCQPVMRVLLRTSA